MRSSRGVHNGAPLLDHLCRRRFRPSAHEAIRQIGGVEGIARRRCIDRMRNDRWGDAPLSASHVNFGVALQRYQACFSVVFNHNFLGAEGV